MDDLIKRLEAIKKWAHRAGLHNIGGELSEIIAALKATPCMAKRGE